MSIAAIIVAAGSGERLAAGVPKAMVALHGQPLFGWALAAFASHPEVDSVIIVAPATALPEVRIAAEGRALVVAGGPTRQESVRLGVAALSDDVDLVLVHDAARPFISAEVISAVVKTLRDGADAVIPVLPVTDTIKRVDVDGVVAETIDRSELRVVQTPQGFRRAVLEESHWSAVEAGQADSTDDAGMAERLGHQVHTVAGSPMSFKITTRYDLELAHRLDRP
jgi:2-C-methyl-D-erythritol 4-phosphate cytidylyltransferase